MVSARVCGGFVIFAPAIVVAALQGCGTSPVTADVPIAQVESAVIEEKHIPPDAHNDRVVPQWTHCSGKLDPRPVPYDATIQFEAQLVAWGCAPPKPYRPNPKAGPDNWWFFALCPMHDP